MPVFKFDLPRYIKNLESNNMEIIKEENGDIEGYEIKHADGQVLECFTIYTGEKYPTSYTVEVYEKEQKGNGRTPNQVLGFNLLSNFLLDAKLIDQPLDLLIDYDDSGKKETQHFQLSDSLSVTSSEQPDSNGVIFQAYLQYEQ